ncbi:YHS domain-containing (seleno)protein [Bradyrhizobium lablabi]|uniref:YHS domain-containing (seleno)protein n=1 Tax=Bradyrhizobium lablabi TaxID=722472 RepID=UPI0009A7EB69|nr:YHS domain-containing (seleno)protein [Bradyrhizobium lablabi]
MTAQRQERNDRHSDAGLRPGIALISVLSALVWLSLAAPHAAEAATTERVVMNRFTGLAIEGFDPVAYFVDQSPERGLPDYEASQAGAVWRFRNEGNRASFVAHPEIYGPQFGGYDPIDLARGVTVAGNPRFWLISGQRLYLFSRDDNRDAFAADPERGQREAKSHWPAAEQDLAQ